MQSTIKRKREEEKCIRERVKENIRKRINSCCACPHTCIVQKIITRRNLSYFLCLVFWRRQAGCAVVTASITGLEAFIIRLYRTNNAK
jgi:hypothetical protein